MDSVPRLGPMIHAVLFDRDGTLISDCSEGREAIVLMPRAREALDHVRSHGVYIGVMTNQPRVRLDELQRIHERIERALGPIDGWFACTHDLYDGCECLKPQPGLIFRAARSFGISPQECALIGDIGGDIEAAQAAGAQGVLVPTAVTLRNEIEQSPIVCNDLLQAVEHIVGAYAAL